jgi:hypothetical protein
MKCHEYGPCFTSCVGVDSGLVVFRQVIGHSGHDDDPVVVVGEGLVVAAAEGGVAADGRSCGDAAAGAGVDQSFYCSGILEEI